MTDPEKPIELGEYRGFAMRLALRAGSFQVSLKHRMTYTAELSEDIGGNITRINNALERIPKKSEANKQHLATLHTQLETAKEEAGRPFPLEEELTVKAARLSQLNTELDNDGAAARTLRRTEKHPSGRMGRRTEPRMRNHPSVRRCGSMNGPRRCPPALKNGRGGGIMRRREGRNIGLYTKVFRKKRDHQPEDGTAWHHQPAGLSAEDGGGWVHWSSWI